MTNGRPKVQPKYTSEGQPICLRCEGIGHMARIVYALARWHANPHSHQRPQEQTAQATSPGKLESSTIVSRAVRGRSEGSGNMLTRERFIERAVGKCPEVDVQIGEVPLRRILDSGSNACTLRL